MYRLNQYRLCGAYLLRHRKEAGGLILPEVPHPIDIQRMRIRCKVCLPRELLNPLLMTSVGRTPTTSPPST